MLIQYADKNLTRRHVSGGNHVYNCPFCGSGTGMHGTASFTISESKDPELFYCFSCLRGGDIYTLCEQLTGTQGLTNQTKYLLDYFNLNGGSAGDGRKRTAQGKPQSTNTPIRKMEEKPFVVSEEYKQECLNYIAECAKNADKTDYFRERGFTPETIKKFKLGYDMYAKKVVFPYGTKNWYYVTRSIGEKRYLKLPTSKAGAEPICFEGVLQTEKPCFICEGIPDAISVMQAGNGDCYAVPLVGTATDKLFKYIDEHGIKCIPIIAMDNDKAGESAAEKLEEGFNQRGIPYLYAYWTQNQKDENDMLQADAEIFRNDIAFNVKEALQFQKELEAEKMTDTEQKAETHTEVDAECITYPQIEAETETLDIEEVEPLITTGTEQEIPSGCAGWTQGANQKAFWDYIHDEITLVPTGFRYLDSYLDGGLFEGVYCLMAGTGTGKTAFCLQMADQIAKEGVPVLYESLEMSRFELYARSLSRGTFEICQRENISENIARTVRGVTDIRRYSSYDIEKDVIEEADRAFSEYSHNLYIREGNFGKNVLHIRADVEAVRAYTGKSPVLIVDYLQILASPLERGTDKQNADFNIIELKRISRDFRMPVIVISSTSRASYNKDSGIGSAKESGGIEYSCDVVVCLQPSGVSGAKDEEAKKIYTKFFSDDERSVELKFHKNRNGRTGKCIYFFYTPKFNHYREEDVVNSTLFPEWENKVFETVKVTDGENPFPMEQQEIGA